jgi:hypothetical protein
MSELYLYPPPLHRMPSWRGQGKIAFTFMSDAPVTLLYVPHYRNIINSERKNHETL